MKTGKRIAVLLLVFIAAAVVYFIWPLGHKEENGVNATYTGSGRRRLLRRHATAFLCCRRTGNFPSVLKREVK